MTTPYWTRVLDELAPARVRRGKPPFTKRDAWRAADCSTCACCGGDPRIPRWCGGGCPVDDVLNAAGVVFCGAVEQQNLPAAREALARIEARVPAVLAAAGYKPEESVS